MHLILFWYPKVSCIVYCEVMFFWSSEIVGCACVLFAFGDGVPLMRWGASVVWHHSLLLVSSFGKTEAAVFSCGLCFLGAFPFVGLSCKEFYKIPTPEQYNTYTMLLFILPGVLINDDLHLYGCLVKYKLHHYLAMIDYLSSACTYQTKISFNLNLNIPICVS